MNVCFLVMAHHQPLVFKKLVEKLSWSNTDIVVHIDARYDNSQFVESSKSNVHFIKRRAVGWATISQVDVMLDLMEYAVTNTNADYFIYLAGTDLPIKSKDEILLELEAVYPKNVINFYPLVQGTWGYGLVEKITLRRYRSIFYDSRYNRNGFFINTIGVIASGVLRVIELIINRFVDRNQKISNFKLYHGSTRWCLNRKVVDFILEYSRSVSGKKLYKFLQYSLNSDEIYFQTIVFNSKHCESCLGFNSTHIDDIFAGLQKPMADELKVYFHYIDWSEARENPAVLDVRDLSAIKQSNKLFACKFTDKDSIDLINLL